MAAEFSSRWFNGFSNFAAHGQKSWSLRFENAAAIWLDYGRSALPSLGAIASKSAPIAFLSPFS